MSDEHDSWFKSAFGLDLGEAVGKIKEDASAAVGAVSSKVSGAADAVQDAAGGGIAAVGSAVSGVAGAVANAAAGVTGAAGAVVKKVAAVVSPSGAPSGGPDGAAGSGGSFPLGGSVGRGGKNAANDVRAVQGALGIAADGQCGTQTVAAIEAFQRKIGQAKPDGRVDAGGATESALRRGGATSSALSAAPATPSADDEGGFLGQAKKGAAGLLDGAMDLGGKVIAGVGEVADGAKTLGGSILPSADGADDGSSGGSPLLASVSGGGGIAGKISDFLSGSGTDFDQDVPIPVKDISAVNGKIKIDIELLLHLSGKVALDSSNKTKLDSQAIGLKVGKWWVTERGRPELEKSSGLWSNFKPLTTDGPALVAETSADTAIGKLSIKVTWVGLDKKLEKDALKLGPKVLEAEGKLEGLVINLGDQEIEGLKFSGLKVGVGGQVTVGPQWKKILADMLKDQLKDQFVKWAERAAVTVGADVIIAGSFIIGGVATIAGAVYQIAFGFTLKDLTESYAPNLRSLEAGFKAGMSESPAPGDAYGKKGHDLGQANLKKLIERTRDQNPQASDEQIRAAVLAKADDATKEAINSGQVASSLKDGMWYGLLSTGKWLFSAKDAATAFQACGLGNDPRFDDNAARTKQWQDYLAKYPTQSKL